MDISALPKPELLDVPAPCAIARYRLSFFRSPTLCRHLNFEV